MKKFVCRTCGSTFTSKKADKPLEEFAIKTHRIYLCDKYDLIMTMAL